MSPDLGRQPGEGKRQLIPEVLPGKRQRSHRQRSLEGYGPGGRETAGHDLVTITTIRYILCYIVMQDAFTDPFDGHGLFQCFEEKIFRGYNFLNFCSGELEVGLGVKEVKAHSILLDTAKFLSLGVLIYFLFLLAIYSVLATVIVKEHTSCEVLHANLDFHFQI